MTSFGRRGRSETGQILPMTAIILIPLLIISAFSIDIGALYLEAQKLQAASDLAALAGAEAAGTGASEDAVREAVDEVLAANGVDMATAARTVDVDEATGKVSVKLTEPFEPVAFGQLVLDGIELHRDSAAAFGGCLGVCNQPIVISPPVASFPATSSGDGFQPLIIGDSERVMTLNHHITTPSATGKLDIVVCVDIQTQTSCPGFPMHVDTATSDATEMVWHEATDTVWYGLHRMKRVGDEVPVELGFGCIDHRAARSCGDHVLQNLPDGYPAGTRGSDDYSAWSTQVDLIGDQLFAVTADLSVICFDINTRRACQGYPMQPSDWDGLRERDLIGRRPSRILDGRIMPGGHSVDHRLYAIWPTVAVDGVHRTVAICFDTSTGSACPGFGEQVVLETIMPTPSLFDSIDAAGNVNGVCSYGGGSDITCLSLDGSSSWSGEYLAPGLPPKGSPASSCNGGTWRCWGAPYRVKNRLYVASYFRVHQTWCVDLLTGESCGEINGTSTWPYAYTKVPGKDCLMGIGHKSRFFTFSTDMGVCTGQSGSLELFPCSCKDGTVYWGRVEFSKELVAQMDSFVVAISDPAGKVLAGPIDLVTEGTVIDLTHVDPSVDSLTMSYDVDVSDDGWAKPLVGEVLVTERPVLVD